MDGTAVSSVRPNIALRILRYPITLLVLELGVLGFGVPLEAANLAGVKRFSQPVMFLVIVGLVVVFVLVWKAFRRWVEGDRDREFALPGAGREAGIGLLAGFMLFTLTTGLVAVMGGIEVAGVRQVGDTQLWAYLGMAIASGVVEETLFRGVMLRQLEKLIGTWWALALTSALFGGLHMVNPDATWVGAVSIMIEAGILLGAAYLYTRRLWLAAGLHAAWNFTQGWVFSVPVSGTGQPIGLLVTERHGPQWLTGGDFGLEASMAAVLVATLAGVALLWLAYRKGNFVAPIWHRRAHSDEAVGIDVDCDAHAPGKA